MKKTTFTRPAAAAALLLAAAAVVTPAQAQLNFYDSQAGFNAASTAREVDSFDDLFWAAGPSYIVRNTGSYSYYGFSLMPDGSYSNFYNAGTDSDVWLSTDQSTDTISFQFNDNKVYAVGGYFFATDLNGSYMGGQSLRLDALDADGHELVKIIDKASPNTFYGFASSSPILFFEISALQPSGDYAWAAANDLTLGGLAAAVPEPAGYG
ncbi:hypothetical protein, partial [Pelomonas sp. KK5]|uniref:hypothetical protein n=1 Tax=Pelomonas sp. KK5 TaxID=1855730 RepID=UPI001301AB4C